MNDMAPMIEAARLTRSGQLTHATALIQRALRDMRPAADHDAPSWPRPKPPLSVPFETPADTRPGGKFLAGEFANAAGSRPYKLYVPSGYRGREIPLIVMMHGCTQSPDDFAAGTRMNEAAEAANCLVLYPGQTSAGSAMKCWKWFEASEQARDRGEPSLIADMTRMITSTYEVDRHRIFAAGLSAGGAACATLAATYPDLFAAIGVHSGLAHGAAANVQAAMAAMRQGAPGRPIETGRGRGVIPAIIFHGDRDTTVHPSNADAVAAQMMAGARLVARTEESESPGGRAYKRTMHADAHGETTIEQWVVHGLGHAWAGGSPSGSFTDPVGPDATAEMLRFFLDQAR